ncbi:MAG: hypothetical protein AABW56_03140, partial [Nanoarchaeota archaeon]
MNILITESQFKRLIENIIKEETAEQWLQNKWNAQDFIYELFPDQDMDNAYKEYFNDDFTKLHLYGNNLTTIPESIGNLFNLQILSLYNNKLTTIPESIGNLSQLKLLYLHSNKLSKQEQNKIKRLLPNTKIIF